MRTVSFNGLCWVDVILAWSANGENIHIKCGCVGFMGGSKNILTGNS